LKLKRKLLPGILLTWFLIWPGLTGSAQEISKHVQPTDNGTQQNDNVTQKRASDQIDPSTIANIQKNNNTSSSQIVDKAIAEFAQKHNINWGIENDKGQSFYFAKETISVDETNPQWAKWRVIAYKKAYMKIKRDLLVDTFGKVTGKIVTKYINDNSDNRLDFSDTTDKRPYSTLGSIINKLLALAGKKLDQALEELDIDPNQFNAAPPEKKKQLLKDKFLEKTVTKAVGSLTGLIPIKTYEGYDSRGNHTIGVIAMYYDKLKQLAYDIIKKRPPMLSKKSGYPISSYIPKDNKALSQAFGIRLVFDELGQPVIISYGQWSYLYKGNNQRKLDIAYDFALRRAAIESRSQIAEFLNSTAYYEEISSKSANADIKAVLDRDSNLKITDIAELVDKLEQNMTQRYSADLRGVKTYKKWTYSHPSGHQIVGVISIWSQKDAQRVDKIRNWSPTLGAERGNSKYLNRHGASGLDEGVGMETDF